MLFRRLNTLARVSGEESRTRARAAERIHASSGFGRTRNIQNFLSIAVKCFTDD